MNDRERFNATMHYQSRDRSPICDFGFWPETVAAWHAQGLPQWVVGGHDTAHTDQFFGMDSYNGGPSPNVGLYPAFPEKVIEDRGDHEVVQQGDGVRVLRKKYMGSIPSHLGHLLVDRESWRTHYKPKLDHSTPGRFPSGPELDKAIKIWTDPHRSTLSIFSGGSLFGWLRDWMGMENIALVPYDDPAWFEEMVTTLADVTVAMLGRVFATGARLDAISMWEDMCFNSGPLLSPHFFKQYLVPQYRRITDLARRHGVDVIWVDCDGKIDDLLPLWLEAGVNCMFPVEVGTWHADPVQYRRQYGRELLMMGGFDKHILARCKDDIEREVLRLTPLVEEGGYIPFADHRVPPDVPLENYMYYLELARQHWGKNHPSLKPLGQLDLLQETVPPGNSTN